MSRKDRTGNSSTHQMTDPSVQRLMENCSRDLSNQYQGLRDKERNTVHKAMHENRSRYCMFVQSLKPVIDEEFGMLGEVSQIEEVMKKLMNTTSTPEGVNANGWNGQVHSLDE